MSSVLPNTSESASSGIIILGGDGMLATAWADALGSEGGAACLPREACDITSEASVRSAISDGTRLVVNCAAWTDVDGAEAHEAEAERVNGAGPGIVAARCAEVGAVMVHYSTDYVFPGTASAPYPVDHRIEPINAYGRTKAHGEAAVAASGCAYLIVRASWLYAAHGKNFARTIARLCRERESLRVVEDQVGRPSSCDQLVRTTRGLLEAGARGIFHAADSGQCSWHEFAREIAGRVNPACRVDPCTSAEFPRPALRPGYSVLDLSATERIVGRIPDWRESLDAVLTRMLQAESGAA